MSDDVKPATDAEIERWLAEPASGYVWNWTIADRLIARIRADAERIKALEEALTESQRYAVRRDAEHVAMVLSGEPDHARRRETAANAYTEMAHMIARLHARAVKEGTIHAENRHG